MKMNHFTILAPALTFALPNTASASPHAVPNPNILIYPIDGVDEGVK